MVGESYLGPSNDQIEAKILGFIQPGTSILGHFSEKDTLLTHKALKNPCPAPYHHALPSLRPRRWGMGSSFSGAYLCSFRRVHIYAITRQGNQEYLCGFVGIIYFATLSEWGVTGDLGLVLPSMNILSASLCSGALHDQVIFSLLPLHDLS